MSGFRIAREITGSKGRYALTHADGTGELTYSILSPRTVIADHTVVDESLRGTGAARRGRWSRVWSAMRGTKASRSSRSAPS